MKSHWPEYAMEGALLGLFMVAACGFTALLEHPGSPARQALGNGFLRRVLMGLAMGATAVAIIYSPWGKRSGAHMNPAVTLTFLRLRKVAHVDAFFYVLAQFTGGALGVILVTALAGSAFTAPPVNSIVTLPAPPHGPGIAFAAEFVIACGMMMTVLAVSNSKLAAYTGAFAALLVAMYIGLEGPFSGMSINPARSFASAAPSGMWHLLWIYFIAPPLGMLTAAQVYCLLHGRVGCAKLQHPDDVRCIHCGYEPPAVERARALVEERVHG
jgi:aquaporin Z